MPSGAALEPECDIAIDNGQTIALSEEPWMHVRVPKQGWNGRLLEIIYRASLLDVPARPIFRFWLDDGTRIDRIATAPVAGAGRWIGRVPARTRAISVSPTNRVGPFHFQLESIRPRPWLALMAKGLRTHPRPAASALITRLVGWKAESDVNLAWAVSSPSPGTAASWYAANSRPLNPHGIDRSRYAEPKSAQIVVFILGGNNIARKRTILSLRAQTYPYWHAVVIGEARVEAESDTRIEYTDADRVRSMHSDCLICVLQPGDELFPHVFAYVAEQAQRHPSHLLFYGDTISGCTASFEPLFLPGWSPRLFAAGLSPRALFVRARTSLPDVEVFLRSGELPASWLPRLSASCVMPLRRVVSKVTHPENPRRRAYVPSPPAASATIIIPTRDHPALLSRVVASIRARSTPGAYQIVIVDNGSVTAQAKALLEEFKRQPDIACIDRPGPFDFSAICNEAASTATSDVLIFLNDDTEVLSGGWLDRLVAHAMDPTIGAVGAKLTYPDGRLQHIGVVVGMGESAGHFGAFDLADAPGWAERNTVLHEVSAVTGACLAVAREKFEAVGGFDAVHLPVELSDIDLCLKLNARGWQAIVDPSVHLMHEESSSRGGAKFRRLSVYEKQRAVFVERWRHVLRDDPFFHPGLSLYSRQAALG